MPCIIVVGGQFGSEGKGKVVALKALALAAPWVVRCGGPNSGHTVDIDGQSVVLRQVPTGVINPRARLLIAAGACIDLGVLRDEVERLHLDRDRLVVDPRAVLIQEADRLAEAELSKGIASTASGVGEALARRASRRNASILAGASKELSLLARVEPVAPLLHHALDSVESVIVEGTQGFGLSLLHGAQYPYVTARDTTASGFASEVGLSPRHVTEVVVVIRTYPIRVGGNSGPLPSEITWDEVARSAGEPAARPELTSVTRKLRRVARFDLDLVRSACKYNHPTSLAVMGLDRLDYKSHLARTRSSLTGRATEFIAMLERELDVPVGIAGTGFGTHDCVVFDKGMQEPVTGHGEQALKPWNRIASMS